MQRILSRGKETLTKLSGDRGKINCYQSATYFHLINTHDFQ
jgi:hypothetical protein